MGVECVIDRLCFGTTYMTALMRLFQSHVSPEPNSGCWLWDGPGYLGYGFLPPSHGWAHRVSYELHKGGIPSDLQIDHLCRVRSCVNPDHLEAVPQKTNLLRGISFVAINAAKTHCAQGHEFTPENTRFHVARDHVQRRCRICHRERERIRQAARRAAGKVG